MLWLRDLLLQFLDLREEFSFRSQVDRPHSTHQRGHRLNHLKQLLLERCYFVYGITVTVHLVPISTTALIDGFSPRLPALSERRASRWRQKIQVDLPDVATFFRSSAENIPLRRDPKSAVKLPHPVPLRGALAIVTNVGTGCGGRGSVGRVDVIAGRFSP